MNPKKRMTAAQALKHSWFTNDPLPSERLSLDQYESSHEFEAKKRRVAAREASAGAGDGGGRQGRGKSPGRAVLGDDPLPLIVCKAGWVVQL